VRIESVAFVRWAKRQPMTLCQAAGSIGLAPLTLATWQQRWAPYQKRCTKTPYPFPLFRVTMRPRTGF